MLSLILASILVVAVALSLIIYFTVEDNGGGESKNDPPVPLPGESVYTGSLIAYPTMTEEEILYISVENSKGSFGVVRPEDDGSFEFFYRDENGNVKEFRPTIADIDDNFEYEDLYAIETGDGYNSIPKLSYLCMALQLPYFEERIALIPEEKEAQLKAYGLSEGEYEKVSFTYLTPVLDENGSPVLDEKGNKTYEKAKHTIKIGDKTTIGTGYYFMVDDREYVYAGFSKHFDYALMGFYSFVNSILVSPALPEDSLLTGFFTNNYYQWLGEMHKAEGDVVKEDSKVIVYADTMIPVKWSNDLTNSALKPTNGYFSSGYESTTINLYDYKSLEEYERISAALVGKPVGNYNGREFLFTVTSPTLALNLKDADNALYEYEIIDIESVIGDDYEYTAKGTPVLGSDLVKVGYKLKINGEYAADFILHAVIDLTNESLPDQFVSQMKAARIGSVTENSPVKLSINYTAENSYKNKIKYVITEILAIYNSEGKEISKVTETSIVSYRYKISVNGSFNSDDEYTTTIDLGKDTTESGKKLKAAIVGKKVSARLSVEVEEYTEYCEFFMDFISYKISRIDYFITREMISGFRFQNNSDRDPYYGESIYENTLENKYAIYGLNDGVCEQIVKILTGVKEDTTSTPGGLVGSSVVAVGITPELMEKYGLYKHEIYFEVPRGIIVIENDNENEVDDYSWYETIAFTLYVSDEQEDGTRYIASDLYDIIAVVDGEKFVFLKYDFINFFARREMMLTDISYVQNIKVEFNLEDMKGFYDMDLNHKIVYWTSDGHKYSKKPDGIAVTPYDEIRVDVTTRGECTPNKFTEYMQEKDYDFLSLTEFYDMIIGNGKVNYAASDPLGTAHLKELNESIYYTRYEGVIPKQEQADIIQNSPMVMRLVYSLGKKVTEDGEYGNNISPYSYVYEYYRYSDNRIMVRLYQASYDEQTGIFTPVSTPVSDFYITNFSFKKIVGHFDDLFNGRGTNKENSYK